MRWQHKSPTHSFCRGPHEVVRLGGGPDNKGQRMWILRPFYFAFSFAVLMEEISMTRMLVQAEFKALYCSSAT